MLKSLLGKTFYHGEDSCWWLEKKKNGRLSLVAVRALEKEDELYISFWLDDEEELWSESFYSPPGSDELEDLSDQITPENHMTILTVFRQLADKVLRKF